MSEKKKSLSDRFGGIHTSSAGSVSSNKDFIRLLNQDSNNSDNLLEDNSVKEHSYKGNKSSLTVHLKINRQRKDLGYTNQTNETWKCKDQPSGVTKQPYRGRRNNYNRGGRQVALKENYFNGKFSHSNYTPSSHDNCKTENLGLLEYPGQYKSCEAQQNLGKPALLGDYPNARDPRSRSGIFSSSELGRRNTQAVCSAWEERANPNTSYCRENPSYCASVAPNEQFRQKSPRAFGKPILNRESVYGDFNDKGYGEPTDLSSNPNSLHLASSQMDVCPGSVYDDYNYNMYNNMNSNPVVQEYGINNNIVTTPEKTNDGQNNGSPTFSSDSSSMSLESSTQSVSIEGMDKKPSGFYYDMSKEVFSEVENLKKIFLKDCENLKQSDQDEKTVEIIKNTLQSELTQCISNKLQNDLTRCISALKESTDKLRNENSVDICSAQEPKKETEHSQDSELNEVKFEGRTLLKGGVKPRHIPKLSVEHPEHGPPTDRRAVYQTCRNLLELPLPKWASSVLRKKVDISDFINKERIVENKDMKDDGKTESCNSENKCALKDVSESGCNSDIKNNIFGASKRKNEEPNMDKEPKKLELDLCNKIKPADPKMTLTTSKTKNDTTVKENLHQNKKEPLKNKHVNNRPRTSSYDKNKRYRNRSPSRDSSKTRHRERSRNRSRSRDRRSWKDKRDVSKRFEQKDYRSRSREVRYRSPVKTSRGSSFTQKSCGNIMSSIMSWHYNQPGVKSKDMFDSDRNSFRGESNDFSFIENR